MAGDTRWGLRRVWDCQDETAKGGGIISSVAVGRRGGPAQAPWCCGAQRALCKHPSSRGEPCSSLPACPISLGGFFQARRCCWLSPWPAEPSESPAAEEELVMEPFCF